MPRLLVIRVGPRWYERSTGDRRAKAASWHNVWRTNVPQGVVSIVDAQHGTPVVRFGAAGEVVGLAEHPAEEGGRGDQP